MGVFEVKGHVVLGESSLLGAPMLHLAKSAILEAFSSSPHPHAFFHHIEDTRNTHAANTPKDATLDRRNTYSALQCLCGTILEVYRILLAWKKTNKERRIFIPFEDLDPSARYKRIGRFVQRYFVPQ